MRTLLLMRHAKSDWNAPWPSDHERPLNGRGQRAATVMGAWLRSTGETPDLVISSSAVRARATAERAIEAGQFPLELKEEPGIYEASARDLLAIVRTLPDACESVMLVGHEPGMSSLIGLLTGASLRFPTAAVARIDLETETWAGVAPDLGTLIWLQLPRMLES